MLSALGNAGGFVLLVPERSGASYCLHFIILTVQKQKRAGAVTSPEVAHQHHVKLSVAIHICIPSTWEFEAEESRVQGWDWREDSADKVL